MTAFQHADSQSMALKTREFSPMSKRTFYRKATFGAKDYPVLVLSGTLVVASVWLTSRGIRTL